MSSKQSGFSSFIKLVIPWLSNWNIPTDSPFCHNLYTLASPISLSNSTSIPLFSFTKFIASWITVRVLKPKKSIFKSPSSSKVVIINCVDICPSLTYKGTYVSTGSLVITTPQACVEACLGIPSKALAMSSIFPTSSSCSYKSLNSLFCSNALSIVIWSSFGIILANLSQSAYGISKALPTSRITILADIVPKVIIWETWSLPYFFST